MTVVGMLKRIAMMIVREAAKHSTFGNICCFYWRNRAEVMKKLSRGDSVLTGIYDFGIAPYALGDILTWNVRLCVEAISSGKDSIDVYLVTDPTQINGYQDDFITKDNYHNYLFEVLPVFYCNPMLRNIHFYEDRECFHNNFAQMPLKRGEVSPHFKEYMHDLVERTHAYNSHDIINSFYKKNRYVPKLQVPEAFRKNASLILKRNYNQQVFFVCVHMRQKRSEETTRDPLRDANMDHWITFFKTIEKRHPEVLFMVIGKPIEWSRELYHLRNVVLVKTLGYGLLEELALINECDLFMGSDSGPAVMAIFGNKPYLIFMPPCTASYTSYVFEVKIGTSKLSFARDNQNIKWEGTSPDILLDSFEEIFGSLTSYRKPPDVRQG